ncbi:hypothetical protein EB796_001871 [Bugula neritina]|uniref:Uncharacterized protein n=1 Tax=Bugula neritina TaxID=10212 RepID=A0A7J7KP02_BUGNE|nr:hypothetical protein EB796_001871 [Bugula neritina]
MKLNIILLVIAGVMNGLLSQIVVLLVTNSATQVSSSSLIVANVVRILFMCAHSKLYQTCGYMFNIYTMLNLSSG